ncbi:Selenocysteine lyase/Cysteine desulfurase [Halanaeroarchaeum sp. HSR-CO]|uniref:aminotransferase class V-fold PLP-dependent enzyme n=1 Tax=Halanaeroarchaeum sp. HSR-CO TaxID=2866382 RepID=UPI00217CF8CA|nr:aminotransferase class V-fold PLP-dependent enzyme [Halanaeroarchaeum sp. HSR-CO]UWG47772.1 Selenocysteine lyase/Cysteine desulfurase [Halanaeroarchaeum sp. HSR-CO]
MDTFDLRTEIPALDDGIYLNWGASGPSPRRVVERAEAALEQHEYEAPNEEGMYPAAFEVYDRTRETIASFVNARPGEIALTQSTTDGINRVATARSWSADDEVVITDIEHSAGRLPWYRLERERGITVTVLETDEGYIDPSELAVAADDATLVCFSAVDWIYGRRHPVSDLVDVVADAGAISLVDAVQVPGQMAMDLTEWGADVVAAAGHKWLLGPWGAGFLYVDESIVDTFQPQSVGYRSVEDPNEADFTYNPGAHRFEVATTSPAPYAGLQEAISTLSEIGMDAIEERIRSLTEYLKDGLSDDRLRSPRSYHSGLVSIETAQPAEIVEDLATAGIHVRALPVPETIRISLHAVNTEEAVDAVLEHIGT